MAKGMEKDADVDVAEEEAEAVAVAELVELLLASLHLVKTVMRKFMSMAMVTNMLTNVMVTITMTKVAVMESLGTTTKMESR